MRLKLAILGPSASGKTTIANLLSNEGISDNTGTKPPYRQTQSVRIVEFTVSNMELRNKYNAEVEVQLWEVGGNPRLKSIWPGVQVNLDGVILVYNANIEAHVREVSSYHMHFVTHSMSNILPVQCIIIGNIFRGEPEVKASKVIGVGPRVAHVCVNIEEDPVLLKNEFKGFLTNVAQVVFDREKANLMTGNSHSTSLTTFSKLSTAEKAWIRNSGELGKMTRCSRENEPISGGEHFIQNDTEPFDKSKSEDTILQHFSRNSVTVRSASVTDSV